MNKLNKNFVSNKYQNILRTINNVNIMIIRYFYTNNVLIFS